MSSNFNFEEQKEQSAIKTEIVTKYFNAWATILVKHFQKIAYVDLFAGPGIYEDGSKKQKQGIFAFENSLGVS